MGLNGSAVRAKFDEITNGVKYAVDYIRANFLAETLNNLPFTTLLVPLAVFFAVDGNKERSVTDVERRRINHWFWRSSFSKRYSSGVLRNLNMDIEQMKALREGREFALGDFPVSINPEFFTENTFGIGNVNTKTFILMLASARPRSFISGAAIDLEATLKPANRTEFHHLMPRGFLRESKQNKEIDESILANFAFMSRADNRKLGGDAPSAYRGKMASNVSEILFSAVCPENIFEDRYAPFIEVRAKILTAKATEICGLNGY